MRCHEFEEVLEQAERPLPADAAAHLNDCGRCRAMMSDLEVIQAAARELATHGVEPPEGVWLSLRAQLEAEGLIRAAGSAERAAPRQGGLGAWWRAFPRPVLAGAYLSFLLAAAMLTSIQSDHRQNQPVPVAEEQAASLDTQLSTQARRAVSAIHQHDPAVAASLRQNLNTVDNFIAMCEKSVREDPQNDAAREYLYGAYQQKAELLAMITERNAAEE
jgi:hypothetical protein